MSSAILKWFGWERVEPQRKVKAAVLKERLAEAEKNFARSMFANAIACASVSAEARKVCQQTADVKRATRTYVDPRKTDHVEAIQTGPCTECQYCEDKNAPEALCLHPDVLEMKDTSETCEHWRKNPDA